MLAQQASDYDLGGRNFHIQEQSMHENLSFSHTGIDQSIKLADYPSRLSQLLVSSSLVDQDGCPSLLGWLLQVS
jgi:hypothetical protein